MTKISKPYKRPKRLELRLEECLCNFGVRLREDVVELKLYENDSFV